jgi:iron complex transport system ATP-binding protein
LAIALPENDWRLLMLLADKVTVKIAKKTLLDNVSLQIKPGELLAVIGPNGAGKSTLLKILCDEMQPTSGAVSMNGKIISDWVLSERAQLCAVLPQSSSLSFPFSVLDVVLMGRSPHSKTSNASNDLKITHQAIRLVGIDSLVERTYTTLSGGERQRVHFARALAQIWEPVTSQTRYLMLDEPTSALDIACQHDCLSIARDFATKQGVAVIAVLHDLNLAALYADRIAVLHAGRLIACDKPDVVINEDLIQHVFDYSVRVYAHPLNSKCPLVVPAYQVWGEKNNINNHKFAAMN